MRIPPLAFSVNTLIFMVWYKLEATSECLEVINMKGVFFSSFNYYIIK